MIAGYSFTNSKQQSAFDARFYVLQRASTRVLYVFDVAGMHKIMR
jgi:hypothetical protein